jgi:spermidine synthase
MIRELHRARSAFHEITVTDENGALTLRCGGVKQSAADAATGLESRQPILNYLHLPLAFTPSARRVLCIGLGGGVLPRRMWTDYPELAIEAVELDPAVVHVARTYFGLPDDSRMCVHVGDGRRFLADTRTVYDIIVVDAYVGSLTPFAFVTREFATLAAARLTDSGTLAYNIVAAPEGPGSENYRRFLRALAGSFPTLFAFRTGAPCGGGRENICILAARVCIAPDALRQAIRSRVGGRVQVTGFDALADRIECCAPDSGVAPLTDAEAPADGLFHA